MEPDKPKVLVTGASGLVGTHLIPLLVSQYEVHAICRRPPPEGVKWHRIDLQREIEDRELPASVDAVVYLAQSDHFREFPERAQEIFDVNVAQVLKLLGWARRCGTQRFVYASSGGVYGSPDGQASERMSIPARGNLGFYLSTKLCAEILVENFSSYMEVAALRFFFAYGKGQKRSMLLPRLVDQVKDGIPVRLQGREGLRINPVHALDAARAVEAALRLDGCHRINVAGSEVLSLRQIVDLIGNRLGREPVFEVDENAESPSLIGDIEKMLELLVAPKVAFRDGVNDIL